MTAHLFRVNCLLAATLLWGCFQQAHQETPTSKSTQDTVVQPVAQTNKQIHPIEQLFIREGLVNMADIDPSIRVDVRYGTKNNFMGLDLYDGFRKVYLQKEVALRLRAANDSLKRINPSLTLVVFDGARPLHIQQMMWDSTRLPVQEKVKYLSNPENGSVHNFGAAVDVSIFNTKATSELDMGTPYDHLGEAAYPVLENKLLMQARLTEEQVENRKLLRSVMESQGFRNIPTEWWHFNACSRDEARKKYALLDLHERKDSGSKGTIHETGADVRFRVQLLISKKKLKPDDPMFHGYPVWMYRDNGWYKYTTGTLHDLQSVYKLKDQIKSHPAFKEAFVVCFNRDKRIGIQEAIDLTH